MAQNVADYLRIGAGINLSACVTVPECVGANDIRGNSGATSIKTNAMSYAAACERIVRYVHTQENSTRNSVTWALIIKVGGKRPCHWR